jgi:hypothetical protein
MLSSLASPTVCVIDDEELDSEPILTALNGLYVSCVHLTGSIDTLPNTPFDRLRLVFLDLHLNGAYGKNAASNTANVFRRVVSLDTAPIVVVIWSKYAQDKVAADGLPPNEQDTEAELFKKTLLGAEPKFNGRLIFVEMPKPQKDDRPEDWSETLKTQIEAALTNQSAVELLWAWDRIVKDGCAKVSQDMTLVAQAAIAESPRELKDGLKATMQNLAKAQSEGDFGPVTAPKHLLTVLTQLLVDQLEHPTGIASISSHGTWLSENPPGAVPADFAGQMNGFLLTSDHANGAAVYAPGTVFKIKDAAKFRLAFGKEVSDLLAMWMKTTSGTWAAWLRDARPILIELSPACDLAQGHRVNALLVAGVVAPTSYASTINKNGEAFGKIANFHLRWPVEGLPAEEVVLGYCNRYKTTLPAGQLVDWLEPWFRLRDLPLASIRNANASHAARVGFVSL